MAIELIPVGTLKVFSDPANVLEGDGPMHSRSSSVFKRALWEGDDFTLDTHIGMGNFMMGKDVAQVEVRLAFRDADGVSIFLDYTARTSMSAHRTGEAPAYIAGRIEVDEKAKKYAWLNTTQIVGKGFFDKDVHGVVYELHALK